jgi:SAM-dependent methyltransferase
MVGDYIFDATLNGAFDSADNATDMILSEILLRRRAGTVEADDRNEENSDMQVNSATVSSIELARAGRERIFDRCPAGILRTIWGLELADVLVAGPISNFRREANDTHFDGDLRALPFPDDHFDVIIETGLCYLSRNQIQKALAELRRVARRGIVLGSVTCDLAIDLLERYHLLASIGILASRWDWSQELLSAGFDLALLDPIRLAQAWETAQALGAGPGSWYEEPESLLYSFFDSGKINTRTASPSEAKCLTSDGQTTPGQIIVPPYGDRLRVVSR